MKKKSHVPTQYNIHVCNAYIVSCRRRGTRVYTTQTHTHNNEVIEDIGDV